MMTCGPFTDTNVIVKNELIVANEALAQFFLMGYEIFGHVSKIFQPSTSYT